MQVGGKGKGGGWGCVQYSHGNLRVATFTFYIGRHEYALASVIACMGV